MGYRILLFLIVNFAALVIGGLFTQSGASSEWYLSLNKAPWTPPGWVFGAAWTTIMICFAVYMALATKGVKRVGVLMTLFILQWILNVTWNPVFFYSHEVLAGLIIISALTLLIAGLLFRYWSDLKWKSILILPYLIWLVIATSLNWYILENN
ncbi:MAG: TspO and like protein [Fluviicola sp.]|jgi:tryptophan-rich sensory protein|uniref:TspO/MBR family protein n=1 Tax=Fluviicola sp. TaxID=1917219 RepID=UPI002602D2BF|nr:TspO/MBR family protein [Fluviicola sp.]MDF3027289.1 TspO and like protein [Fluviicola sp.]